ncbi:MAG: hypothetical protein R3A52_14885 [Polyangiales bacterium]
MLSPSRLRVAALSAALSLSAACAREVNLAVLVVTPDGGDPFAPPDGATQARVTIDDPSIAPQTVAVDARGGFTLALDLGATNANARMVIEALDGATILGSGATPPLRWSQLGAVILPVFVQRRDSVVEAPWGLGTARTSPFLFLLDSPFVAAFGGARVTAPIDVYDNLTLNAVTGSTTLDDLFNRDASALRLADGRVMLVRGCAAITWSPSANAVGLPMNAMPPTARCDLVASTAVQDPAGGGWILGGRGPMGPSDRVDRVLPDGSWEAAPAMVSARVSPSALRLGPDELLVAGGQSGDATFLERWGPSLPMESRALTTGVTAVDRRDGATLFALGGGVVAVLGGVVRDDGSLSAADALIDTGCLNGSCPVVIGTPTLLTQRRRSPAAALANGDTLLVASGTTDGTAPADALELLDLRDPRSPTSLGTVGRLPFAGLSLLTLHSGSVWIAGGGERTTWIFRH